MKKLTLLAAAALATLSMNAADVLYLCNNDQGWNPANPTVLTADADGVYTFTTSADFKLSTTKSTSSSDWSGYESGVLGLSQNATAPGTYNLQSWNENISVPWAGTWTITISDVNADAHTGKITFATEDVETFTELYILGSMNGWVANANYKFSTLDGELYTMDKVSISSTAEFKIADAKWTGSSNWGSGNGVSGTVTPGEEKKLWSNGSSGNLTCTENYVGPVQFKKSTGTLILGTFPTEAEPVYTYYLANEWTGWGENADWQFTAGEEEGVYTLGTVDIKANASFVVALATDGVFDINNKYGYAYDMETETAYNLVKDGQNMTLANDFHGTVNLTVAGDAMTIEFVPEEIVVRTLYVIGDAVGGWAGTGVEMTPVSNNVYTVSFTSGLTAGEFKVWDGTWDYNFGGNAQELANGNNEAWFDGANFQFPAALAGHPTVLTLTIPEGSDVKDSSIGATLNVNVDLNTGVEVIGADNSAAEYYNMQGVRVANPENGIFIVRQGGKTYKVVVK